jgi:hypothetical protein
MSGYQMNMKSGMAGINSILKEAWITSQSTEDKREKIHALSLARECYSMKLELLTNATVVDDAIRFVSSRKSEEDLKSSSSNTNESDKESNEPDYEEPREINYTTITTNEVF